MNIRTIRATANNIITALEIANKQTLTVMKYMIKKDGNRTSAQNTADRMNEEIDGAVSLLCTFYITAVDGDAMKYNDELQKQIKKVNDLRVSVWDAIDLMEDEERYEIAKKIEEGIA